MTSTVQLSAARLATARVLITLAIAWSVIVLALASWLMWGYISEFNGCADLRIDFMSPVVLGLAASLPSVLMAWVADRIQATGSRNMLRFVRGAAIAAVVLFVGGMIAPKPGPPCIVRQAHLMSNLKNLATMQEAFMADSHRYSRSFDTLGVRADEYNYGTVETRIVWADTASWGAYSVFTHSRGRWICAIFYPDDSGRSREVEGVGRFANGCWDPKHPNRIESH